MNSINFPKNPYIIPRTKQEEEDIYEDFCKCDKLARELASRFPEEDRAWTGTVSDRLNYTVSLLIKNQKD